MAENREKNERKSHLTNGKSISKPNLEISNNGGKNHTQQKKNGYVWKNKVGNTTFTLSRNIAERIPCEKLYLKFEGNNPSGTQKDRIAMALAETARKDGYDVITTATCGNFGAALTYAADFFSLKAQIFVPEGYHLDKSRLKFMKDCGGQISYVKGHYEDAVYYSSNRSKDENWYNANPGMNGSSEVSINAYSEIGMEIYRNLRRVPDYILCPVGNGTTIAGIFSAFKTLKGAGKISSYPRMVAVSTRRGNPIIKSYKMKSKVIVDLDPKEIIETKINEPLTNWHSFDGQPALDCIYESKGFGEYATDSKMQEYTRLLRQLEGLNVLPASASTLAVLSNMTRNEMKLKGTFVAILSGRNY